MSIRALKVRWAGWRSLMAASHRSGGVKQQSIIFILDWQYYLVVRMEGLIGKLGSTHRWLHAEGNGLICDTMCATVCLWFTDNVLKGSLLMLKN